MNYFLVMPAAGSGRRFQGDVPKQYAPLMGRTVIEWALAPFLGDERCAHAVVVIAEADSIWPRVAARLAPERVSATPGGVERSDSVRRGLGKLAGRAAALDWVLVHDAARPCLEPADLARLISRVTDADRGGLLAAPAADTLKQAREASERAESPAVARTIDRSGLWRALTPQMFRYGELCAALQEAYAAHRNPSDEAQALEWRGEHPLLVEGAPTNLKVTTSGDLKLAEAVLRSRRLS
ncbi:MAG TPA: 2-C-methyl-D-erythritol 4-phosphate cytidylyltransferase [Steroidobacteraceae bacterium]|nr:2-C-methyl-D-erythritol 4-phosphate cytidylyltransferase [Steroidobacteraceae bacterium]